MVSQEVRDSFGILFENIRKLRLVWQTVKHVSSEAFGGRFSGERPRVRCCLSGQFVVSPKPAERIGENRASMIPVVGTFAVNEFDVVVPKYEGGVHLLVPKWPVAMNIVEIVASVLHENAERLFLAAFPDQRRIVVTSANIGKAANVAEDFAKLVGPLPGHCEGANTATADAANRPAIRIVGYVVLLMDFGDNLLQEEGGVFVAQCVVFDAPIRGPRSPAGFRREFCIQMSWVDEYADGYGHLFGMDQIVEYGGNPKIAILLEVGVAVLKDH